MDSFSTTTSSDTHLWNESEIWNDEINAILTHESSSLSFSNSNEDDQQPLSSHDLVPPSYIPFTGLLSLTQDWMNGINQPAQESEMNLPDDALSLLRDMMGEFDFEQYQMEADFLNFIYGLCSNGIVTRDHYKTITERTGTPSVITRKWLDDNPTCDIQGISWGEQIDHNTTWVSRSVLTKNQSVPNHSSSMLQITESMLARRDTNDAQHSSPPSTATTTTIGFRTRDNKSYSTILESTRRHRIGTYSSNFESQWQSRKNRQSIEVPFTIHENFQFFNTFTTPRPHLTHFQLRNLVCPVDKNCIYFTESERNFFRIKKVNPDLAKIETIIMAEHLDPGILVPLKISALDANDKFVVGGGHSGQYVLKRVDASAPILDIDEPEQVIAKSTNGLNCGVITSHPQGITNHVSIYDSMSKTPNRVVFASNDCSLRTLDIATDKFINSYTCAWAINCTAYNPSNSEMMLLVGDNTRSYIIDANSNQKIAQLCGHQDYGFACAWSSDGNIIATGNQDGTCRIYDIRNTSKSLHTINTPQLAAIRCMTFDSSGRFLAFSEPVDYVSVIDTKSDFQHGQIIEMWGDIVGLGFSKGVNNDGQYLTVGNCDRFVGGIIQYEQKDYEKFFSEDFLL